MVRGVMNLQEQISRIKSMMGLILEGPKTKSVDVKKLNQSPFEEETNWDAVLVGGLEERPNDLSLEEQVKLFNSGFGGNVKGFHHYNSTDSILSFVELNPEIPIFLFSQGCNKSQILSQSPFVDKQKLFIIEPFTKNSGVFAIVEGAISNGVPRKNVFVGPTPSRGSNIQGASKSEGINHWDALSKVGAMKSELKQGQ